MSRRAWLSASLRSRAVAFGLDYLLIAGYIAVLVGLGAALQSLAPAFAHAVFGSAFTGELTGFLMLTLPVSVYFAVCEASPRGATWGKRRRGLRVVDYLNGRLGLKRSALRTAAKFAPWELSHGLIWQFAFAGPEPPAILSGGLVVVWALVGANLASVLADPKRRSIYDRLAGTLVLSKS